MAQPPYDPAKDFVAIGIIANSAISIGVHPSVPAKNLPELIAYIKANPGKVPYGTAGAGTFTHLAGEMFKQMAGTPDVTHIPYRGGGPVIADVVSGHIPMMVINITNHVIELHKTGKIRLVAVFTPKRLSVLPDVPAAAETLPGLIAALFVGVFAPAATPKAVIDRIAAGPSHGDHQRGLQEQAHLSPASSRSRTRRKKRSASSPSERARIIPLAKSLGFQLK